ncbi:MAG: hypothetical protein A9Z00_14070 [Thermobacillus sp. ZCTH02-B1]|mgnify:CR=1 FL=1|uniref:PDGLE domain-containing protein n=1 Tax=Thermobacillus sp. ZCTH02-B1 TaxID=1858795 RepID=UPI000B550315|nr:PDGLE domain-containing protein [Thermobacillus sp. ZCTH02-B1]OUM95539.1 MAG: hypothetical protein A9Z00_14070 [Thermobacillus sp. ZCTH02-B1]
MSGGRESGGERGEYRLTGNRRKWIVLAVLTLAAAGLLSPWASDLPDGLERVAGDLGFIDRETAVHSFSPMPDYEVPGIRGEAARTGLAGLIGSGVLGAVLWCALRALAKKER